jgi:gamma-glutamyltranspeptidase/glutathione hydrolase
MPFRCDRSFVIVALLVLLAAPPSIAAQAPHAMVAAEHELAADAGVKILQQGGNAVDAACAMALAVGVTNASSCGIGGGGFMLIYMAKTGKVYALNYRERAPMKVSPGLYLRDGKPDDDLLRTGPLAVSVPGEIAGIADALRRFGTLKFPAVAAAAIELARNGFPCGDHLAREIAATAPQLARDPGLKAVFLNDDGSPRKAGDRIVEKDLANTLGGLGDEPTRRFYSGEIASAIASFVTSKGGVLSVSDLADYRAKWQEPLAGKYREYLVYTMPPPSSGGGMLLEMLAMLDQGKAAGLGVDSPAYLARLIEVMREGFIDRAAYGDPDFVKVPLDELLSPTHIRKARDEALHRAPGAPSERPSVSAHDHGTSHLCVVDREGNVVALTTTINTAFGAKLMVPGLGIILNNEMDDFSAAPGAANVYRLIGGEANAIAPGKRPLSSMTPTIVTKKGRPVLVLGGSGGPTIISGVLQILLDVLDFHMVPDRAMAIPRIHEQASPDVVAVEAAMPQSTRAALGQMGYKVREVPQLGAVSAIVIQPGTLRGAGDPRKGGAAAGY